MSQTDSASAAVVAQPAIPGIGGALITTVHVEPGWALEYNRWYDRDHFYAMMNLPWCFTGARWTATAPLRARRLPADSAVAQPVTEGNFLSLFFAAPGHVEDVAADSAAAFAALLASSRMHRDGHRRHVFTAHHDFAASITRDGEEGPAAHQALDHPFDVCVMEVLDAPDAAGRPRLVEWLLQEHLPERVAGSAAAMCLIFLTRPFEADGYVAEEMSTDQFPARVVLLWMVDGDLDSNWERLFVSAEYSSRAAGVGRVEFVSAYRRLIPGVDQLIDDL